MTIPTLAYADLFAGIGGFAAALSALGLRPNYAVEIDAAAAATYERNWGHSPLGDLTVDANEAGFAPVAWEGAKRRINVAAGGFPCQPFSKSGAQRGMEEVRGTLFFNILALLLAQRPTAIVLENVRNLIGPRHVHEWEVIKERLHEAGYQVSEQPLVVSPHQIHPAFGGSPQIRERVFITGTLVPGGFERNPEVRPATLPAEILMDREWDLARDLPLETRASIPGTELSEAEVTWIDHWDEMVKVLAGLDLLPSFPLWSQVWTDSERERAEWLAPEGSRVPGWKVAILRKNWALMDALSLQVTPEWLYGWLAVTETFPLSRQKLEWQAQEAGSLWDCVISLRPSGLRVKRMTYLPALVAITQTPILGPLRRRLSVREAARLQGLPDNYSFGDQRDALSYKQLGNGVNTGVVWNVLKAHVRRDAALLAQTEEGRALVAAVEASPDHPGDRLAAVVAAGQGKRL